MASDTREWSVPSPVRALLWWPAISFVLVLVAPDAAVSWILIAGAVLALVGALLSAAARRLRRRAVAARQPATDALADAPTTEFPTVVIPSVDGSPRRAA